MRAMLLTKQGYRVLDTYTTGDEALALHCAVFRPTPSPSRSPASTCASRRAKGAGIACAPTSRVAGARPQGEGG
jgi:hypothetical protein